MPGSIVKRGKNSWSVIVDLGRDPVTGKRRQLWRSVKGTKREAEAMLVRLLHERDSGIDIQPGRLTVGEYLERWLEDYASHNVSPRTHERYAGIVRKHLVPALGSVPISKLRPQHIQAYYSQAARSGRLDKKPGGLSARTVLHHHRVLREALHHAVRWQVIARNPADAVAPPRPSRAEMQVLGPDGVQELLAACNDPDLYAVVFVAVSTGLREGELLALRWSDVNLDGGNLQVTRNLQYLSGRGTVFAEPKTDRSRRKVAFSQETLALLTDHRRQQLERRVALGGAYRDQGLVFADPFGNPMPPYRLSQRFARVVRAAGLAPLRFHDLRHTSASLLLSAGVHPKVVSERLGHAGVSITLDTYSHVLPGLQEEAADLLDAYLRKPSRQVG
ncbi:MAG: tyrosine-type recombinase/integrase [Nitrospirota bacterium]|nr:tyrosine-type recombinase/integrase [Nitrospirota bacterium]